MKKLLAHLSGKLTIGISGITVAIILLLVFEAAAQSIGMGSVNNHTIVLKSDGTVHTWGYNLYHQLGNGTGGFGTDSNVPVDVVTSGVLSGKTVTAVAAGLSNSIALASDGTVYTWGNGESGELGNGTSEPGTESSVPVAVDMSGALSGKTITAVSEGNSHSIVLASDGTVYTWGYNDWGPLGNGNNTTSDVPVAVVTSGVLSGKTITGIAAGYRFSVVLASDGKVYAWGENEYGQLGNGSSGDYVFSNEPVAVVSSGVLSGKTITAVAAGGFHTIALASDGNIYAWGNGWSGELGNGSNTASSVPVAVDMSGALSGKTITAVAAGRYHSIAYASDGTIYTWGYNEYGQLGNGNNTNSNVPVAVDMSGVLSGKTITAIAAGNYHTIALSSDGLVYTWGRNDKGQLGIGNNTDSNIPVEVDQSGIGSLPVELISFTVEIDKSKVVLKWKTATEVNNYGFEVERQKSRDCSQESVWEPIGFVTGHGNSNSPKEYQFIDRDAPKDSVIYRLKQIDTDGSFKYYPETAGINNFLTGINEEEIASEFVLCGNYPNPFNPTTTIEYQLPAESKVNIRIYNMLGELVEQLINEDQVPGLRKVEWNASNYASGVYIYQLFVRGSEDKLIRKKMLLVK